jgi:hypothetical protein
VRHIEKAWARGQAAVKALRDELHVDDRDALCPLYEGGVSLHKIYGVMHDTCNTANLVAELIIELQERKHRDYLTDEVLNSVNNNLFTCRCPNPNPNPNILAHTRSGNLTVLKVKPASIFYAETIPGTYPLIGSIDSMTNGLPKT